MFAFFSKFSFGVQIFDGPLSPPPGSYFFFQQFNEDGKWQKRWKYSEVPEYTGFWKVKPTKRPQAIPGETMIFTEYPEKYYGLSTKFPKPLNLFNKTLCFQYEMRFMNRLDCGGVYMKLFGEGFDPLKLDGKVPYVIMFGPDRCGPDAKVHFIFRYKNPLNGIVEERHLKERPVNFSNNRDITHLYSLIVRPDNSFDILYNAEEVLKHGNLLEDFVPPVNPNRTIDDPTDQKPRNWDDNPTIPDLSAIKPDDWNESEPYFIYDPAKLEPPPNFHVDAPVRVIDEDAVKPEEWDEELYGPWEKPVKLNPVCYLTDGCGPYEPPIIVNPNFKGKWIPPNITNPNYKGEWRPRQFPNPRYYEDLHPHNFPDIHGVGWEIWLIDKEQGFNNVYIGTNETAMNEWNRQHFLKKRKHQLELIEKIKNGTATDDELAIPTDLWDTLKDFKDHILHDIKLLYHENQQIAFTFFTGIIAVPFVVSLFACGCIKTVARLHKRRKRRRVRKAPKE